MSCFVTQVSKERTDSSPLISVPVSYCKQLCRDRRKSLKHSMKMLMGESSSENQSLLLLSGGHMHEQQAGHMEQKRNKIKTATCSVDTDFIYNNGVGEQLY